MTSYEEVYLSDNKPFRVPRLGIFELDTVKPDPMGPFTYKINVLGKQHDAIFDIHAWDTPPEKPQTPKHEVEENSSDWYAWNDYELYQAGVLHERRKEEQMTTFLEETATYILSKCPDDTNRIVTGEDWKKVYETALVPPLTVQILADTLTRSYQAEFNGIDVFTALESKKEKLGRYNTIKVWENELMMRMQLTELEYALLPLEERARKVCAMFLPDIISYLEIDHERLKANNATKKES